MQIVPWLAPTLFVMLNLFQHPALDRSVKALAPESSSGWRWL